MVYPTKRTPEIIESVLDGMAHGEMLTVMCKKHDISTMAWYQWCDADQALSIAHAQARKKGFDAIAEDCVAIADKTPPISDNVQQSKLRVETRLKLLAKWDPKRYGERMNVDHSGSIDLAGRIATARTRAESYVALPDVNVDLKEGQS